MNKRLLSAIQRNAGIRDCDKDEVYEYLNEYLDAPDEIRKKLGSEEDLVNNFVNQSRDYPNKLESCLTKLRWYGLNLLEDYKQRVKFIE